jgi:hypothetical protein
LFSQHKRATASRSWFGSTPPFEQFSFQRNERPQYRPSEQGDVLRKQQGAEREHPESQHRKETKIPKMINSNPTGTRTQRDDDPLSQRRKPPCAAKKLAGYPIDLPIEPFGVTVAHRRFVL